MLTIILEVEWEGIASDTTIVVLDPLKQTGMGVVGSSWDVEVHQLAPTKQINFTYITGLNLIWYFAGLEYILMDPSRILHDMYLNHIPLHQNRRKLNM